VRDLLDWLQHIFCESMDLKYTSLTKRTEAGGTVQHVIPRFRIPDDVIKKDVEFLKEMDVIFHFNYQNPKFINDFRNQKFEYIFIGIGAHIPKMLSWCKEKDNIFEALSF